MPDLSELDRHLSATLTPSRYSHSLGVAETARNLAYIYGVSTDKAYLAGLSHDLARELSDQDVIRLAAEWGTPPTELERSRPVLLHGKASARLLERDWGVTDAEVLDAVACHTVGKAEMGPLAKILFVADFIEPGREYHSLVAGWNPETLSLDTLLARIVSLIRDHLIQTGKALAPEGEALWLKLKTGGLIP